MLFYVHMRIPSTLCGVHMLVAKLVFASHFFWDGNQIEPHVSINWSRLHVSSKMVVCAVDGCDDVYGSSCWHLCCVLIKFWLFEWLGKSSLFRFDCVCYRTKICQPCWVLYIVVAFADGKKYVEQWLTSLQYTSWSTLIGVVLAED